MFAFILILMMIIAGSSTVSKPNEFNKEYISKNGIASMKGIFVFLIVLSHAKGYFMDDMGGFLDKAYLNVQNHLGQMVVALFLFYSGYGIMEQIKKREFTYIKSIATKRFPSLLLNYDIAVVLFLILALALKKTITVKQVIFSLIAWDGLGNSSWYIFVTLVLYILTFISFSFIKLIKNKKLYIINIILFTALTALFVYILIKVGKESWWWNTALLFPLGFWYSYFKDIIEKLVMKNDVTYLLAVMGVTVLYVATKYLSTKHGIWYFPYGFMFVAAAVVLTMKVNINSNILNWFGDHIFSIYILQRIPMIIMDHFGLSHSHRYVFVILTFAITCAMAEIYDILFAKLSGKIWKPKQIKS